MLKNSLLIFTLAMLSAVGMCYADREPSWMNELPKPDNETYLYVREVGDGASLSEALNSALARVMQSTANRLGQPFDSQKINEALQKGTNYEVISHQYNIPINKVDQYEKRLKDGTYRVWVLCQVAKSALIVPQWTAMRRVGEDNNITAMWKSMIIPGLGQMGKGRVGSGVVTLIGEVALVGSGIGCYYMAQNQLDVMKDFSTSYDDFAQARNKYNSLRTTSYIVWSAAGVLYVYNVIRALTMQPKRANGLSFVPSMIETDNGVVPSVGFTLSF